MTPDIPAKDRGPVPADVGTAGFFLRSGGWTVWSLLIVLFIRLLFTGIMGMMPQDAYYDFYAQHLDLSYYDHPPMIAYLLRTFTTLLGKKVFVLKLADTLCTWGTVLLFYKVAVAFLSPRLVRRAMLLLLSTLLITLVSLISTPDVPLLFFWTATLLALNNAIFEDRKIYWLVAGILSGLAFDSKYTAIFLTVGTVGFLLFSKKYRRLLFSFWFLSYILSFAVLILPVFVWNYRNHFASFVFQSSARVNDMSGTRFDVSGFAGVIGHQAAVLMPVLFFFLFFGLWKLLRKYGLRANRIPDRILFLLAFFIPAFLGFFLISFFYWVKINWMMPAYITGIIWICRYWSGQWVRRQMVFALVLHVVLAIEIAFYPVPIRSDDTWFGWQPFAREVAQVRQRYPDAFIFSCDDYKTAAMLNFYLPEMVYSRNVVGERALQFDFIGTNLQTLAGRNAIYIDSNPRFDSLGNEAARIPDSYKSRFDRIESLQPILVSNHGRVLRKWSVFLCKNYHPLPGSKN